MNLPILYKYFRKNAILYFAIIFIVGLHNVFTDEEVREIYKEVCVNKISIINIEYQQFDNISDENYIEKVYIFDRDNCEI